MKYFARKTKTAVAMALSLCLLTTTAYAAEAEKTEATPGVTTEEGQTLPVLTFEEALEKAQKKNSSLIELQKNNDFLQESKEDLWDVVGSFALPSYDYQKWVNSAVYGYTTSMYNTESGLVQNKYSTQITKLAVEVTIMNTFSSILENEANLEVTKESARLTKVLYTQGQLKYNLGLISKYQLEKLKVDAEKAETNVSLLEKTLDQAYINLNSLMGEAPEKRFTLEYEVSYKPYEIPLPIDTYIGGKLKTDLDVLLAEKAVEDAKFNKNYMSEDANNATAKSDKNAYEKAQRNVKNIKTGKDTAIRNAYIQLQQADENYAQAKADLNQAQADVKVAEANYNAGNTTKLTLEQAQLGVKQKETALKNLEYAYTMQVFSFENTSLVGSGSKM